MIEHDTKHSLSRERIGLFIDGRHLFEAACALGVHIDYRKFLCHFQTQGDVNEVYYYNTVLLGPDGERGRRLFNWLAHNGYTTRLKLAKCFTDENGIRHVKNCLTGDIVFDMLETAPYLDRLVLVSGHGDLSRTIDGVQRKGKRVTVVSTMQGPAPMAAFELYRRADRFDDLSDLVPLIARISPSTHKVL
jgi:uncharacterized LabA/DUF88 family protein